MPYPLHCSRENRLAKASAQDSNDDEGNISDFSDYPSNGARLPDLNGRGKHSQSASTIRLGGNVRSLHPSPNMIGNPVKAPARGPPPIPPLEPISDETFNNDDECYEDMEEGDEEEDEDEEDDKIIEINEAREVMLHRVQQGSRAIKIKEMIRRGAAGAPVIPSPPSDKFNPIHILSNPQGSQLLDQDTIFESGLESGFETPLRIKGLSSVPFEAGNISSVGKSSVEKGRWPKERGGILRKPVPNSADGPNSYFLHGAASVRRTADSHGESPACSPVAHSKQYRSDYKTIGYSRLKAAKAHAQEVKLMPDAVNNYLPGAELVPSLSRTESEETITGLRRRAIPETDVSEQVKPPANSNDDLGSWCNPVVHREDGLRSHPTSPQLATPTAQRAPTVPAWVKLGRPLPPLPKPASSLALKRRNTQER